MNSLAKPLYQLLRNCILCEQRLQPYKLNEKQVAEVFIWLDQRRRGSVDVGDFYTKFPELNECELFYIFKYLDSQRKGALTHQNLQNILTGKSLSNNHEEHGDSIRNFTNLVRVLKATFYLIEEHKRKLNITSQYLEQIFDQATLMKKDRIDMKDLLLFFKETGLEIDDKLFTYLESKVFDKISLTPREFVQLFCPLSWDLDPQQNKDRFRTQIPIPDQKPIPVSYLRNKTAQKLKNTEKINSDIDKILQKYRNPTQLQETFKLSTAKNFENLNTQPVQSSNYTKTYYDKLNYLKQKPDYRAELLNFNSLSKQPTEKYQPFPNEIEEKKVDKFNQEIQISECSKQINKRREELRRGSLERQKIIDNIMNKKKATHPDPFDYSPYPENPRTQYTAENQFETRYNNFMGDKSRTPTASSSKPFYETSNYENGLNYDRLYDTSYSRKQQLSRPASATKTSSTFYDRSYGKLTNYDRTSKPELNQFYRKPLQIPKTTAYEKQNILKRAEEEATKKIQEIQRRARLKVMQKRSAAGVYNRWLK